VCSRSLSLHSTLGTLRVVPGAKEGLRRSVGSTQTVDSELGEESGEDPVVPSQKSHRMPKRISRPAAYHRTYSAEPSLPGTVLSLPVASDATAPVPAG
jgi:hypothetical protein